MSNSYLTTNNASEAENIIYVKNQRNQKDNPLKFWNWSNYQQITINKKMSPQKEHKQKLQQQLNECNKEINNVKKTLNDCIFGNTRNLDCLTATATTNIQMQSENESDNNISSCSTLDIDKKVNNIPTSDLENQVNDLKKKLKLSEKECNEFKRKLHEALEEKERSYRRLEVISSAHESRITEMHCVIAELSKKLRNKQELTIFEENEPADAGSEFSFQEGSIYNSENNLTNPDAECQTEPIESDIPLKTTNHIITDTATKTQVEALQEEILHLKAQIALLQSQIANEDSSPEALKNDDKLSISSRKENSKSNESRSEENYGEDDGEENDAMNTHEYHQQRNQHYYQQQYNDDCHCREMKEIFSEYHDQDQNQISENLMKNSFDNKFSKMYTNTKLSTENITPEKWSSHYAGNITLNTPTPKMAERVKLRKTTNDRRITGNEIVNSDINNTKIVEHLVSDMIQTDELGPSETQNELQRLQRRVEHYKVRNSVLELTLDECKEHCEHLYLLCGKYESNAIALQLALNCSDRAIEAYDVMLALLESKLALLQDQNAAAEDSRKAVETVARHLLDRLESEKNLTENSMGPWQNNFCINSSQVSEPWTVEDDNRLRNHVSKLKGRRSAVQNTVVDLESPFNSDYNKIRNALEVKKDRKTGDSCSVDLEMAILMQELMSLREDIAESRQKIESSEREKKIALEKVFLLEEALSQLQTQFTIEPETPLSIVSKDRQSYSEAEHAALIERQLVEALTRETQLKSRIQALVESVSASKRSTDEKYIQVQNNIAELQKTNESYTIFRIM